MAKSVSLIELLISITLISMVLLSVGALYTSATGFFSTFEIQAQMQHRASIALQDMVKNIYSAERVEVGVGGSEITVWTSEVDFFRYWLDGSEIRRGNTLDYELVARGVNLLNFVLTPANPPETYFDILQINLVIGGTGRLSDLEFATKIAIREYE